MLKKNLNISGSSQQPSKISLSQRNITDKYIPSLFQVYKTSQIIDLNLSHNELQGQICTWSILSKLTNIRNLNLSHNNLKHSYLNYLSSSLETLDISHNRISQIHFQSHFSNLKQLNVENNTILRFQITYQNNTLRFLKVNNNKLSVLGLGHLTVLSELVANNNQIVVVNLPSSIQKVNLSHNMLKTISFISKLNILQYLDISHNQIKQLQFRSIQTKNYLIYLDASYNRINFINGLQTVHKLQVFNLSNNFLAIQIKNQILKLKHLREFQCHGNQFKTSFNQIQIIQNTLKRQLPIKTLKIFDSKQIVTSSARNSERKRTSKKYTYIDSSNVTNHRKRQKRTHSQVNLKNSPFKLFVQSSTIKPIQYTLGNTHLQKPQRIYKLQTNEKQYKQPQTKYFLSNFKQILQNTKNPYHAKTQVENPFKLNRQRNVIQSITRFIPQPISQANQNLQNHQSQIIITHRIQSKIKQTNTITLLHSKLNRSQIDHQIFKQLNPLQIDYPTQSLKNQTIYISFKQTKELYYQIHILPASQTIV